MLEPTLRCPACKTEIKLTESLAAPLLEAKRQELEEALAAKERDTAEREKAIRQKQAELEQRVASIDEEVAAKGRAERARIAAEEAAKARRILDAEIGEKDRALAEITSTLKDRDDKLTKSQNAQAELLRKQLELEDEKSAIALTVQEQVQSAVRALRDQHEKRMAERDTEIEAREKAADDQLANVAKARAAINDDGLHPMSETR